MPVSVFKQTSIHFAVAIGIGLLIGSERKRRKGSGVKRGAAGVRTFALAAFAGALSGYPAGDRGCGDGPAVGTRL
jgi:uncharacterized membrane protein YhiD involved in acid resistance